MASALNQTPATGADAVWTLIDIWLNPRKYQPVIPPPAVIDGCGPCGGSFLPSPCEPFPLGSCDPCGPPYHGHPLRGSPYWAWPWLNCDPPDWCGPCDWKWKATQSGFTGGGYTLCGLLQKSAADFQVPFSWACLQTPPYVTSPRPSGGVVYHRQFTIQRGADNTQWCIMYSARAGFTGGTPGATQRPTAADERPILGGGTAASPVFATLLPPDGTYRAQTMVYEGALSPGFYLVTYPLGNPTPNSCFMLDPLAHGSYPVDQAGFSREQDPVVIYQRTGADTLRASSMASEVSGWHGWLNYGLTASPAQSFTRLPSAVLATYDAGAVLQQGIPRGLNQSTIDPDSIVTARATYYRRAALGGTTAHKGDASAWLWNGIVGAQSAVLISQKLGNGVSNPYFWLPLGDVLLRWDSVTKTVLL